MFALGFADRLHESILLLVDHESALLTWITCARLPEGGAPPPSYDRCYDQIVSPMHGVCGEPKYNAGSVNIQVMPSYVDGRMSTGLPVDGKYPSYVMVPQQSYNGVNSEDPH